ncbi:MAG TPA: polyprenyl synthetase family protein [Candidatus Nanopelagicaceae bacterium]
MSALGVPNVSSVLEQDLNDGLAKVEELLTSHIKGNYPLLEETSYHLVAAGGKRLRPLLTLICSHLGDPTRHEIIEAAVVCELTHLATLFHDDVMDEAPLRRGVESANSRWGNSVAILTGDYLFAKVSNLLADLGPEAVRLQARTFERLVIGQIMETQGASVGQDPIQHYLRLVSDKTASLISTSARFGAFLSGASPEIVETVTIFGEQIGVAFQLADDVIDISSDSHLSGKTPGTDLREGVPTFVTLNVLKSADPADRELQELLKGPIKSEKVVAEVLAALRAHPALEESKAQLLEVANKARLALGPLPICDATAALFSLCETVIERSH